MKKRIAIFDLSITSDSPAGSCILQLVKHLADEFQFVIFADRFENPDPQKIAWIRVPLPNKPVIARYVSFKYLAPSYYRRYAQQQGEPDLIIATEGEFSDCDICYVHFCHRAYLAEQPTKLSSLRDLVRFANHHFNARTEADALQKASTIVVPSQGLANQLARTYSAVKNKEVIPISNPIDVPYFTRPNSFNVQKHRQQLGFTRTDIVLVFVALGSFPRKGLDFILRALAQLNAAQLKLLVVGGNASEIETYTGLSNRLKIANRVKFIGLQTDVRPYLWLSNLFVLPSSYETFSLVTFQAAVAGLPLVTTQLYGVSELLEPGTNGWLIERNAKTIAQTLKNVIQNQHKLSSMGAAAHQSAAKYNISQFIEQWRSLITQKLDQKAQSPIHLATDPKR